MKKKRLIGKGKSKTTPLVVGNESRDGAYERARQRALHRLENPPDLGIFGKIPWSRDGLHERHPAKKSK